MRRLKEREKEKELDNRDRQREKEEFEEIKRKLFDEGHPDAETEVARVIHYAFFLKIYLISLLI